MPSMAASRSMAASILSSMAEPTPIRELRCAFNVFDDAVNIMQTCSADLQEIYVHLERQYKNMTKCLALLRNNAALRGPLHVYYGTQGLQRFHIELVMALDTNIEVIEQTMTRVAGAIGRIGYTGNMVREVPELPAELDVGANQPWDLWHEMLANQKHQILAEKKRPLTN